MTAPAPLDDRACWLLAALRALYDELDPDAVPVGVSVQALSGGQVLTYGVTSCSGQVTRLVTDLSDLGAVADALKSGALSHVITDATVPGDLGGNTDAAT